MHLNLLLDLTLLLSLTCTDEAIDEAHIEDKDSKTDSYNVLMHPRFRHDEICLVAKVFLNIVHRIAKVRNVVDTE